MNHPLSTLRLVLGAGEGVGIVPGQAAPAEGGATPPADPSAPAPEPKPDEPLGESGLRALQAERDARAAAERQVADLAARVKSFEDANKTVEERAAEQLTEAQRAAEEAQRTAAENAAKALRYEAAAQAGLPLTAAARLQGSTLEELVADAESFKALIGVATADSKTPPPDPSQGQSGTPAARNLSEAISAHYGG